MLCRLKREQLMTKGQMNPVRTRPSAQTPPLPLFENYYSNYCKKKCLVNASVVCVQWVATEY